MTNSNYLQRILHFHTPPTGFRPPSRESLSHATTAPNTPQHVTTYNRLTEPPTTACCDLRQSQYRQQENKRRAGTRRHTASSLAARRSSTVGEPTVSRATAWLSREGIVCALRRPPAEHRRQRGPPTHAVSGGIGRRQPPAGSAATTRDTMGLTTPSPLAFKAGHNRFSHDLRQLGQLVQLLSYNPRPRGLVLHSIRIGTYPLPLPTGAGQAVRRDVMCPWKPHLRMRS